MVSEDTHEWDSLNLTQIRNTLYLYAVGIDTGYTIAYGMTCQLLVNDITHG